MGLFKDIKSTMQSASEAASAAQQMQAQQQGIASGAMGYDASDPAFAPIEGVDCDTYARVMGLLGKNMIMGPENVARFVTENGVPEGKWQTVQLGWTQRMQQHPQVAQRIGVIMSQHSM